MRWVIGDIHGMLVPLKALVEAVRASTTRRFYFVGDYVNRGPDSRGVIDYLLTMRDARFCRGNHDDVFDMVLSSKSYAPAANMPTPLAAFLTFMQYGIANTFASYGADWDKLAEAERYPSDQRLADLVRSVPQSHRDFIRQLEPAIEDPDVFIAHAMIDPDTASDSPDIPIAHRQQRRVTTAAFVGTLFPSADSSEETLKRTGYFDTLRC